MPQSKKRQHPHPPQHNGPGNKTIISKTSRLEKAGILFFSVLGLLISYFIAGADVTWLITGTIVGAVAGYFFGKQMHRTFSK